MKLALLGIDHYSRQLVEAACLHGGHELIGLYDVENDSALLPAFAAGVPRSEDWQALLGAIDMDVVIVAARRDERRTEQLRGLVQAGVPLIVSHPVIPSVLVYYELDMIRQDSGCRIIPYLPARLHPAVLRLAGMVARPEDSPIGAIEQIIIERTLADRSPPAVIGSLARDVDLAAALAGRITEVAAMAPGGQETSYANLGVQMSGPPGIVARWSVGPVETTPSGRLVLRGTTGWLALDMPEDGSDWKLSTVLSGQQQEEHFLDWHPGRAVLEHAERCLAGDVRSPAWDDALAAMEVVDSVQLSLQKGRTIQLLGGRATEEGTFKGMMASAGCGLMLLGLLIVFSGLLLMWLDVPGARFWPYILLVLLLLFLLLQLLRFVFAGERN